MNAEKSPRVSIVLPTYNRVELLQRAVSSIIAQTFTAWEFIPINDASTDGTRAFLDNLAAHDSRVRPIHHAKNNYPDISKTLNEGLAAARGGYIARLDDDDYWSDPDKLKKQVALLDGHLNCVIVGGGVVVVDENDRERFRYLKAEDDATIRTKALFANPFSHSTVMFRRDIALAAGGYGNYANTEDWDLWLRMGLRGTFHNIPEYFLHYLMTSESKTFLFKHSQSKEILEMISAHRHEYPNFTKAYVVALGQYYYSLFPLSVRRWSHVFLSSVKRSLS